MALLAKVCERSFLAISILKCPFYQHRESSKQTVFLQAALESPEAGAGAASAEQEVRRTPFFAAFYTEKDQFTKTGSGQA
jgi:hypothetical protein